MNPSENFKIFWWLILVVAIGYFLINRFDILVNGKPTYFDTVVFLVWVGVCLAPVFKDISIFGVKLKTEIEDLKRELNYQLSILKTEIKSSIEVSTANSNQIFVNTQQEPPKDSEIPDITAQIKTALEKLGIKPDSVWNRQKTDESIEVEFFQIRLAFEKLINRYSWRLSQNEKRSSLGRTLNELKRYELISQEILIGVQEVVSICNYAVHGEKITEKQIAFVRESAPALLQALETELKRAF